MVHIIKGSLGRDVKYKFIPFVPSHTRQLCPWCVRPSVDPYVRVSACPYVTLFHRFGIDSPHICTILKISFIFYVFSFIRKILFISKLFDYFGFYVNSCEFNWFFTILLPKRFIQRCNFGNFLFYYNILSFFQYSLYIINLISDLHFGIWTFTISDLVELINYESQILSPDHHLVIHQRHHGIIFDDRFILVKRQGWVLDA